MRSCNPGPRDMLCDAKNFATITIMTVYVNIAAVNVIIAFTSFLNCDAAPNSPSPIFFIHEGISEFLNINIVSDSGKKKA